MLTLLLAGAAVGRAASGTSLTMLALNGEVGRAVFHLRCTPAGGDLPNPAKACAAIQQQQELITAPRPFICAGADFSWWDITISGRLDGAPVWQHFSTCWTTQMETLGRLGLSWRVLRKHLVLRRHGVVLAGTTRVFAPGVLRPVDLVVCKILGHRLEAPVPIAAGPEGGGGVTVGYGGGSITSVFLTVKRNLDDSVTAHCDQGKP